MPPLQSIARQIWVQWGLGGWTHWGAVGSRGLDSCLVEDNKEHVVRCSLAFFRCNLACQQKIRLKQRLPITHLGDYSFVFFSLLNASL